MWRSRDNNPTPAHPRVPCSDLFLYPTELCPPPFGWHTVTDTVAPYVAHQVYLHFSSHTDTVAPHTCLLRLPPSQFAH